MSTTVNKNSSEVIHVNEELPKLIREHLSSVKNQNTDEFVRSFNSICASVELISKVHEIYSNQNDGHAHSFSKWIANAPQPVSIELPESLLWTIIDSFVTRQLELNKLNGAKKILNSLVNKSNIQSGDPESVANEFGCHPLYMVLGCFSLVGMLRLHLLREHYDGVIKVLELIEIHKNYHDIYSACQISMSYYVGLAYMMMRRYTEAIRTFNFILLNIHENKQLYSTQSYHDDQINEQTEQMYRLLTICLVLCPQNINKTIRQQLS